MILIPLSEKPVAVAIVAAITATTRLLTDSLRSRIRLRPS